MDEDETLINLEFRYKACFAWLLSYIVLSLIAYSTYRDFRNGPMAEFVYTAACLMVVVSILLIIALVQLSKEIKLLKKQISGSKENKSLY